MASRHDDKGRALRGSECQMQLYVNAPDRRALLDETTLAALPSLRAAGATTLDWRSPLQHPLFVTDHPFHEYRDGKVLDAVGRPDLRAKWAEYWPGRSQRWDALAVARDDTGTILGPVLVEAKSYPGEFRPKSGGTRAEGDRLALIERRLHETREWLAVAETPELTKLWLGPLYQSANRFAALRFFRSFCDPPADAWLLNLYFINDTTHINEKLATPQEQWEKELPGAEHDLGFAGLEVPHSGRAYVEGGTYDELVAATGG
jgi:hypothetical protein